MKQMHLTFKFLQHNHKPRVIETNILSLTMTQMKELWNIEQVINGLVGSDVRLHIDLTEAPEKIEY